MAEFEIQNLTKQCNEILILSKLAQGTRHGYQLAMEIETDSDGFFRFNHGTLYPILHKLEKERLIKGVWKPEGLKRKRKTYSLTARGKKYLEQERKNWHDFFDRFFKVIGENPLQE
ncbi:helix-turn-helix transcriptional regulator [candidate division KSB1 bacterium]|nr:helix-turn-helix transcriptional regulator [candidate division KSB1 bacterium]